MYTNTLHINLVEVKNNHRLSLQIISGTHRTDASLRSQNTLCALLLTTYAERNVHEWGVCMCMLRTNGDGSLGADCGIGFSSVHPYDAQTMHMHSCFSFLYWVLLSYDFTRLNASRVWENTSSKTLTAQLEMRWFRLQMYVGTPVVQVQLNRQTCSNISAWLAFIAQDWNFNERVLPRIMKICL